MQFFDSEGKQFLREVISIKTLISTLQFSFPLTRKRLRNAFREGGQSPLGLDYLEDSDMPDVKEKVP